MVDGNRRGASLASSCGSKAQQQEQQLLQQQEQQQQQREQQQGLLEQACIGSCDPCSGSSSSSSNSSCCCICCCSSSCCSVSWRERARRRVESDLQSRGFLVREGLALGVDFLCYAASPSEAHASFVVYIHSLLPSTRSNCSSSSSCSNRKCDCSNNSSKRQRTCSSEYVSEAALLSSSSSCCCCSIGNSSSSVPACFLVGLQRLAQSSKKDQEGSRVLGNCFRNDAEARAQGLRVLSVHTEALGFGP
ncbi:hypothetical protein Esti_005344 [Eimeria stiedai]